MVGHLFWGEFCLGLIFFCPFLIIFLPPYPFSALEFFQ